MSSKQTDYSYSNIQNLNPFSNVKHIPLTLSFYTQYSSSELKFQGVFEE